VIILNLDVVAKRGTFDIHLVNAVILPVARKSLKIVAEIALLIKSRNKLVEAVPKAQNVSPMDQKMEKDPF
jgi:hypothetical protein